MVKPRPPSLPNRPDFLVWLKVLWLAVFCAAKMSMSPPAVRVVPVSLMALVPVRLMSRPACMATLLPSMLLAMALSLCESNLSWVVFLLKKLLLVVLVAVLRFWVLRPSVKVMLLSAVMPTVPLLLLIWVAVLVMLLPALMIMSLLPVSVLPTSMLAI